MSGVDTLQLAKLKELADYIKKSKDEKKKDKKKTKKNKDKKNKRHRDRSDSSRRR